MVQLQFMDSRNLEAPSYHHNVAANVEEQQEHVPPPIKRRKPPSSPSKQQWNASESNEVPPSDSPSQYNSILDEPGPLGLRLRKSPSLLDLIQMKLSAESSSIVVVADENLNSGLKKANQGSVVKQKSSNSRAKKGATASSASVVKHKASNFSATLLRIGSWEYKSKYEGDLVARCYFAKNKLVWEFIEDELKSKIEIQWSDIMALKADCPDNGPSSLTIVLASQPRFFRETNPQPKKHTLWLATSDFTDGQASKHRKHFLRCPQGILAKHFEKLIQCDTRLNFLSRQPEIIMDSPLFDGWCSASKNIDNLKDLSPPFKIKQNGPAGITLDSLPCEASSSSSGMDGLATEGNSSSGTESMGPISLDQIKLPGLRRSMSVSDFIGHVENCLSEEMTSGNPSFSGRRPEYKETLDDIAKHLLSDNQATEASSDEKSLMSRVNSLCCLLQKDPVAVQNPHEKASAVEGPEDGENKIGGSHDHESVDVKDADEDLRDVSGGMQAPGMSRKDSFTDLLLSLPRIASLPKFLSDISEEDSEIEGR